MNTTNNTTNTPEPDPQTASGSAGPDPQAASGSAGPILQVAGLRVHRVRPGGLDTIINSVTLSVAPGETIGIVGESGSGKSMTARAITGLLPPTLLAQGQIRYQGRDLLTLPGRERRAIRGRQIGLILQDPFTMLNPVQRCGRIIEESLLDHHHTNPTTDPNTNRPADQNTDPNTGQNTGRWGGRRAARRAEAIRRLAEVGITDETVADRYPFQLSGGMRQRVAIAAALARDPRILIADEPSTALDAATQREILTLIKQIQHDRGMALILITHDLRVAFATCDRIHVIYAGTLIETGPATELATEPLHPYTHGLLLSEPPADHRVRELLTIPGSVPNPDEVTGRCTFAPRCRWATDTCHNTTPPLQQITPTRHSACTRLPQIRPAMATLRETTQKHPHPPTTTTPTNPLIRVRDAHKTFHNGNRQVTALNGVNIDIGANESVGIVGESGSGKTTLARTLVGLEHLTSGTITIDNTPAANWTHLTTTDQHRLRGTVQIIFQDPYSSLNPMRTIGWTLTDALTTHNPTTHDPTTNDINTQVTDLLQSVGLPATYARRKPVALSGGERQRVAIARALAAKPRLLICDEPVSALDVSVQAQILNLLTTLRTNHQIGYLFITHDLSIVRQITDRLYVMHHGHIIESGPTEQILNNPHDPYTTKLLQSTPTQNTNWLTTTTKTT
jgi:peptide/nickel transport system ATP-binding protein